MIRKAKLKKNQLAVIHAQHGHSSGKGLSIYSVKHQKKVHLANPIFVEHRNGKRHTVIAKGVVDGHKVSGIVKHR